MRTIGFAGAAVLLAASPGSAQNEGADGNWQRVVACAQEPTDAGRHSCIDEVLGRAGVLATAEQRSAGSAEEQRRSFGLSAAQQQETERRTVRTERAPVPAPAPVASPSPAVPAASAPRPQPPQSEPPRSQAADVDSIATTVSRAFDPGNRLLVIITAEGQIWQQSESKDIGLPPRPGTAFSVEQGALGSFTCRIGTARSFRCRRQG